MYRLRSIASLSFGFLRREQMEERLSAETRFHIDMATEDNLRAGLPPEEAKRAALLAFGARQRWAAEARDEYRSRHLEEFAHDVRYAIRNLRRSPSFTFAAVVTLALSIGATTSMFSVVNAVLLRGLPYPDSDRIAVLCELNLKNTATKPCNSLNAGNLLAWRDAAKSFSAMGAFRDTRVSLAGGGGEPVSAQARTANVSVLSIIGARAAVGRLFGAAEDTAGGPNVLVLSHAFWQRQFGGDSSVVGKTILMNAFDYTVVGVAAPDVSLYEPVDLWIPMRFSADERSAPGRSFRGIARLRPGVTFEQADRELRSLAAERARELPDMNANWTAYTLPLRESLVGGSQRALWVLFGAVGFLLMIACANVANLLLARGAGRAREVAVRISLGASPRRIVRQLLTESVVLSLASAVIGLAIAYFGTRALVALVPAGMSVQSFADVTIDWRVLLFSSAIAIGTGIAFGIAPAYHALRADVQETLKEGGRGGASATRSSARLRNGLVIAEISLALVLLAGAGLMVRSFAAVQQVRLGFEPAHTLTARIILPRRKYSSDTLTLAFFRVAEARVASLPGVVAVGSISYLPLSGQRSANGFNVEGLPVAARGTEPTGDMRAVTPGYFKAMGIAIKEGRGLTDDDVAQTPAVGIVSETLARTFWPNGSAVGHYLLYEWNGNERVQIVGVAADVHHEGADKQPFMEIYRPLAQFPYGAMSMVVRGSGDAMSNAAPLRAAIHEIDRDLPIAELRPMSELVAQSLGTTRLSAALFALFGVLGLVLAAVGIYGVMSYTVQQRRHEIGIRMALGARAGTVVGLVMRRGATLALIGIVVGTIGGLIATRLMSKLLFGIAPSDPGTFATTAAILGAVALLATYVPGRRATMVNPVTVLRGE
jgi:putative ABC transport system permease protein